MLAPPKSRYFLSVLAILTCVLLSKPAGSAEVGADRPAVTADWQPMVRAAAAQMRQFRPLLAADLMEVAVSLHDEPLLRLRLAYYLAATDRCEHNGRWLLSSTALLVGDLTQVQFQSLAASIAALQQGKPEQAREQARALLAEKDDPAVRAAVGLAESQLGRCRPAADVLKSAITDESLPDSREPTWQDVYLAAYISLDAGALERAERLARLAREQKEAAGTKLLHARALTALQRCDDVAAILASVTADQFGPASTTASQRIDDVRVSCAIGVVEALAQGQAGRALEMLQQSLRHSGAPHLRLMNARAFAQQQQCSAAAQSLATLSEGDFLGMKRSWLEAEVRDVVQRCPQAQFSWQDANGVETPHCPNDMVHVAAGPFVMGLTDPTVGPEEQPAHPVTLDGYCLDRHEVTQTAYLRFLRATDHREPSCGWQPEDKYPNHPVVCVTWDDAQRYCTWLGRRLPTEAEWEKAARGSDGRRYPWGNETPTCKQDIFETAFEGQGCGKHWSAPVDTPAMPAPSGALYMAGNVSEWVSNWYDPRAYLTSPHLRPTGPVTGELRTTRGGNWMASASHLRVTARTGEKPAERRVTLGFRCARKEGP